MISIGESTEAEARHQSTINLLQSEGMTVEMMIPYLYQYRNTKKMLLVVIGSLQRFPTEEIAQWVPLIVYVYSISGAQELETFLHQLAIQTIPLYLSIRWCLATYMPEQSFQNLEKARNKLDAKLINSLSSSGKNLQALSADEISTIITKKQVLSNYINVLNNFYEKLFKIPSKLKKYPVQNRNHELHQYVGKLYERFASHQQTQYCTGICFPIEASSDDSYLVVKFIKQECLAFTTKDRVPFKLAFETINFSDYDVLHYAHKETVQPIGGEASEELDESSLVLPHSYFGEDWRTKFHQLKMDSQFGHLASYQVRAYVVKSGDDIRQEYLAMQLMQIMERFFEQEHLKLWVKPYQIIPFNKDSGMIEFLHGTKTISSLKASSNQKSLRTVYKQIFGDNWETAITNFTRSLAGYSLFQYLFQVKDRHNNNIMIDKQGHIIHIDFSYMISSSPGNFNFEKAHFKLTEDYIELMEGTDSDIFQHFKFLLYTGLKFVRKYKKQMMSLIQIMKECENMKCFSNFDEAKLSSRFHEHATDGELQQIVQVLVSQSYSSYTTSNYDRYQWYTNQIHS